VFADADPVADLVGIAKAVAEELISTFEAAAFLASAMGRRSKPIGTDRWHSPPSRSARFALSAAPSRFSIVCPATR